MRPAVLPPRGVEGDELPYLTGGRGPRHSTAHGEHVIVPTGGHQGVAAAGASETGRPRFAGNSDLVGRQNHERAARTARRLDGALAGAELAERLRQAWVCAGKPPMAVIGDRVGYSKATISKVLSGKMPPAWRLVRKLGDVLGISTAAVTEDLHPLWIAADTYRRTVADAEPYSGAGLSGHACEWCGAWIVNTHVHAIWHLRLESPARCVATEDAGATAPAEPHQWATLRDALGPRDES